MAKDTFYFSHDYNARQDEKIKRLIRKHGMLGYGIFWSIIEDLYNNTNVLRTDYEGIAYELRVETNTLISIINDFDLFCFEGEMFGSESIEKRLKERNEKSKKAIDSINARWEKHRLSKGSDTNVLQTYYDSNTIKERKGKEIKESIDGRKLKFSSTLKPFLEIYGKKLLNEFYAYWTEPTQSGNKFKKELERTWDVKRRLEVWSRNSSKFEKPIMSAPSLKPFIKPDLSNF